MAFSNNMTKLLNKIERRLGTRVLNLPDNLKKDSWATVVEEETLDTFSRFFPYKMTMPINDDTCKIKNGYYLLNEDLFNGIEIIGVRDITWSEFGSDSTIGTQSSAYGMFDIFTNPYGLEDIALMQVRSDQLSLFNNGIYIEFEPPNRIALKNCINTNLNTSFKNFKVDVLLKHSSNLNTISPTKMETFEALAKSDIATYLYNELKYFDNLETVFASTDLKIGDLQTVAQEREMIIAKLEEGYVSASNDNQPIIFTV